MISSPPARGALQELFDGRLLALPTSHRYFRTVVHRFLSYLQTDFPEVRRLSDLRRDPHLLGWIDCLGVVVPPLSHNTRRIYLSGLRRLFRDFAAEGHALQPGLLLPEDFRLRLSLPRQPRPPAPRQPLPRRPPPSLPHPIFGKIFEDLIQTLATTLAPNTILAYRSVSRCFLSYLQTDFPEVRQLSELRRNPHMCGWFRHLCQKPRLLANLTRTQQLCQLRRLLHDLASQGYAVQPDLILRQDFPQCPRYLPRALSPEHDRRLQEELRRSHDLLSHALLLTRATGIRIGECMDLAEDCLRSVGQDQWALHVPLGKLHTERWVPADPNIRQVLTHILALRAQVPSYYLSRSVGLLLPRSGIRKTLYRALCRTLKGAAARAGCPPVSCHQLRHTYASEMIRLGVSLPALMQLLGHKDIRMTMRYVQVTQLDLQREFHLARHHAVHPHQIPQLSPLSSALATTSDVPGIRATVKLAHHLLEMYRRQIQDERARQKVHRLDKRLLRIALELDRLSTPEK
jgi:site-specific recombinase XerD